MKKEDFALESFKNKQDLIKFMDQKASVLLVVYGFVLSIYIKTVVQLSFINPFTNKSLIQILIPLFLIILSTGLGIILCMLIYIITFKIILPRIAKHYDSDEKSLIYFEHIVKLSRENFISAFKNLEEADILSQLLCQNYELSVILNEKNRFLRIAIQLLFYSIILLSILLLLKSI